MAPPSSECLAGNEGTLRQDIVVNGAGGLQSLWGIRRVEGSVVISVVTQADVAQLSCLEQVSGKLEISGGALADLHGLEGLQSVGESLAIEGLSQLTSLAALRGLRTLPLLTLMDLPALTSLTGLEGLTGLPGFKPPMVANTSLGLTIARCNALRDLSGLDGVQHLGGMSLSDNPALTSLAGLDGVRTLGCASGNAQCNPSDLPIEIIGCPELADLSALSNATGTLGLLRMNGNQRLTELTALHGLAFDDISLSRNTALVRISGQPFPSTSIKTLYVNEQSTLETLQGLENLQRTLLDGINIRDNPVLRSLDALSQLTTVTGSFIVRRSPQLTAIGFPMLTSITGSVYLEGLTMVPKCQVDALLARTGATCESCTGLDEAATCL